MICAGADKAKDHRCGVTGYTVKIGKICTYVTLKCANCGRKHQATAFRCPARAKVQAKAWKERSKRLQTKKKRPASPINMEKEPETTSNEMELDSLPALYNKNPSSELSSLKDDQFNSPRSETSEMYIDESQNHTKKF